MKNTFHTPTDNHKKGPTIFPPNKIIVPQTVAPPVKSKKKPNIVLIVGILLMLTGGSILGYIMLTQHQHNITDELNTEETLKFEEELKQPPTTEVETPETPTQNPAATDIPIPEQVGIYNNFGILHIPKLGSDYKALITEGDDSTNISGGATGVNYYPNATMPSELGNFTLAGHRGYWGKGKFENIQYLKEGDNVYVETKEGFYKYTITHQEVVDDTQNEILLPVPHKPEMEPTESIITLTTCWYEGLTKKRLAVYGTFGGFEPHTGEKLNLV